MRLNIAIILIVLFITGCAHVCVDKEGFGRVCKSELLILPRDFPDELFLKYWTDEYGALCYPITLPNNVGCAFLKSKVTEAVILIAVISKDNLKAWCFATFNGKGTIIWLAEDTPEYMKEYAQLAIDVYNEGQSF